MARRTLIQRQKRGGALDRYLHKLRYLELRVSAHTPVRFLRRLGLIGEFDDRARQANMGFELPPADWPWKVETETPLDVVNDVEVGSERSEIPDTAETPQRPVYIVKQNDLFTGHRTATTAPNVRVDRPIVQAFEKSPVRVRVRTPLRVDTERDVRCEQTETRTPTESDTETDRVIVMKPASSMGRENKHSDDTQIGQEIQGGVARLRPLSPILPKWIEPQKRRKQGELSNPKLEPANQSEAESVSRPVARNTGSESEVRRVREQDEDFVNDAQGPREDTQGLIVQTSVPMTDHSSMALPATFAATPLTARAAGEDEGHPERSRNEIAESATTPTNSISVDAEPAEPTPAVASRTRPPEIVTPRNTILLQEASEPDAGTFGEPEVIAAEVPVRFNEEKLLATPSRRARVEEISSDRGEGARAGSNVRPPKSKVDAPSKIKNAKNSSTSSSANRESEASAADGLFANKEGVDRSPEAWAKKLQQAFNPTVDRIDRSNDAVEPVLRKNPNAIAPRESGPKIKPAVNPATAPTQKSDVSLVRLSESTRRFLKPLVGIDPAAVPLYEGPLAERITSFHHADAVAVDGSVMLASSDSNETGQKKALIAHELTHIARQHTPRFVPPVARSRSTTSTSTASSTDIDEEALARRVEARVMDAAAVSASPAEHDLAEPDLTVAAPLVEPHRFEHAAENAAGPSLESADPWGGLPAPWEPLPGWMSSDEVSRKDKTIETNSSQLSSPASVNPASTVVSAPVLAASTSATNTVERAEQGRILDHAPTASAKSDAASPVAPDVDALARQVYSVLKRRLQAESRRLC